MDHSPLIIVLLILIYGNVLSIGVPIRLEANSSENVQQSSSQVIKTCRPNQFIKIDCKLYIDCYNGHWRRNYCPPDKFWSMNKQQCIDLVNVPECQSLYKFPIINTNKSIDAVSESTRSSPEIITTSTTTTTLTTSTPSVVDTEMMQQSKTLNQTSIQNNKSKNDLDYSSNENGTSTKQTIDSEYYEYEEAPDDFDDFDDQKLNSPLSNENNENSIEKKIEMVDKFAYNQIIPTTIMDRSSNEDSDSNENDINSQRNSNTQTVGQTCIVRGKTLHCIKSNETNDNAEKSNGNTTTSSPPVQTLANCTIGNSTQSPIETFYTLQVKIKVDHSVIRLVQAIAYYVNLTIISLKST